VRITEIIDPRLVVVTFRIDDEGISVPMPYSPSVPARIRVLRNSLFPCPDFAECACPFERLDVLARTLNDFE
jgi:hypothetical protein